MNEQRLLKVILNPHMSEKSSGVIAHNQYVFKVAKDATKSEIKNAIKLIFDVDVTSVQICNIKPRKVRFGRIAGKQKSWKKAYVKVADGNQIDLTGAQV